MTFRLLQDPSSSATGGMRSYEVYQRERVREGLGAFPPRLLYSEEYRTTPHAVAGRLREQFACYRDWVGNSFWVARYDDVTSVFADDANFETRSARWQVTGDLAPPAIAGRDLRGELEYQQAWTSGVDRLALPVLERVLAGAPEPVDLVLDLIGPWWLRLVPAVLGLPEDRWDRFALEWGRLQRGREPLARSTVAAVAAHGQLVEMLGEAPGPFAPEDLAATLLEEDAWTMPCVLANLWCLLLLHPDSLEAVKADRLRLRAAYYEALRHSPPWSESARHTRHEVERFGRLLPAGARVVCSAAAANRDPRVFSSPDRFWIDRKDLCQREPRGQYRADGLASGISFGTGRPSVHPALPEDRPRSRYALTRDTALAVSGRLLDAFPAMALAPGAAPAMRQLWHCGPDGCWSLPVTA